jgi:endonuclease/exonuclease/phosphatase family metal-dependent hydrolase
MKTTLKILSPVIAIIIALILSILWASSATLENDQLSEVINYSPDSAVRATGQDTFTVMAYNIGYLSGMTNNLPIRREKQFFAANLKAAQQVLDRIKPDFVGLQEIDFQSDRSFYVNQLDSLARHLKFGYAAKAVNWDERYVPFPYWPPSVHFGRVMSGQAILSRYPIEFHERIVLERPDQSFYYDAFYLDRLPQVVEVDVGRPLIIINVHLESWDVGTRERQALEVLDICSNYAEQFPILLIGDFNVILPYAKKQRFSTEEYDIDFSQEQTIASILEGINFKEAFPEYPNEIAEKVTYTYPADNPMMKIDHIFYSADKIAPVEWYVARSNVEPSDHLPVVMTFRFVD